MNKKYSVLIYPLAENDLQDIQDYFKNILKIRPDRLFEKFLHEIELLGKTPFIRPLLKDQYLQYMGYRMSVVDNYLIFFIVKGDTVQIHRILYGRRDYMQILKV